MKIILNKGLHYASFYYILLKVSLLEMQEKEGNEARGCDTPGRFATDECVG